MECLKNDCESHIHGYNLLQLWNTAVIFIKKMKLFSDIKKNKKDYLITSIGVSHVSHARFSWYYDALRIDNPIATD